MGMKTDGTSATVRIPPTPHPPAPRPHDEWTNPIGSPDTQTQTTIVVARADRRSRPRLPLVSTKTGQKAQPAVRHRRRQALGLPGLRLHLRRLPRPVGREQAMPRVRREAIRAQDPGRDEHRDRLARHHRTLHPRALRPRQARVIVPPCRACASVRRDANARTRGAMKELSLIHI